MRRYQISQKIKNLKTLFSLKQRKVINYIILGLYTFCLLVLAIQSGHKISNPNFVGDESYYIPEAVYTYNFGTINALAEGTSISYSLIIIFLKKLLNVEWQIAGRLTNYLGLVLILFGSFRFCRKVLSLDFLISHFVTIVIFSIIIPFFGYATYVDSISAGISLFACIYFLQGINGRMSHSIYAGGLLFLAFTFRPTVLFLFLAFFLVFLYLLIKYGVIKALQIYLPFFIIFSLSFLIIQLPSLNRYGQVQFENKDRLCINGSKEKAPRYPGWFELNTYFILFPDVHNKQNKWGITFDEVEAFIDRKGIEVLPENTAKYIKSYPKIYAMESFKKVFFSFPYELFSITPLKYWINVTNLFFSFSFSFYFFISVSIFWIFILLFFTRFHKIICLDEVFWIMFILMMGFSSFIAIYAIGQLETNWLIFAFIMFIFLLFRAFESIPFLNNYKSILILSFGLFILLEGIQNITQ